MTGCVLSVDQGTSASKAMLVDSGGHVVGVGSARLDQHHPAPGWVEQSPDDVWGSVREAVAAALSGHDPARVEAVGLSTQRESVLVWDRATGAAVGPLLSWQDRRTANLADKHAAAGAEGKVLRLTGLPLDPMFSALKAQWLLDEHDPDRARSRGGELCVGTVDSWLVHRLGGPHVVEIGNAARTQLLDIGRGAWSGELAELFGVPLAALPEVVRSTGPFCRADRLHPGLTGVPVTGVLGDSHAALFAHGGWGPGAVKVTYGTGSSVMGLIDTDAAVTGGLCRTLAWQVDQPAHAVEGNIRATGATLSWLAKFLGCTESELVALAAPASDGVHVVPAFNGLGAPWWDGNATGLIDGLTLGTGSAQVARAVLESIAFQVEDVVSAVDTSVGRVAELLVDGGPTSNDGLMQLQADTSRRVVVRAGHGNLSALGAAHLAGLSAGVWRWSDLRCLDRLQTRFEPRESEQSRANRMRGWHQALDRSRSGQRDER
jgi:glycerol kinase